jgi:outer membrane protein TolC
MKNAFRKLVLNLSLFAMAFGAYAGETLTLSELREEVLNENIDVKIQYEKYYQAQQNVRVKLGEFLPSLNVQLLFWNSTYAILYSVVPTPSDWFTYTASKELAIAEKFVTDSIKLNILRDLTLSYINIKHQEKIKVLMLEEEKILEEALATAQSLESLGMGNAYTSFSALRALLQHRQQIFALDSIIAAQKEGLLLAINRAPTQDLELAEVELDASELPETVEEAITMALNNAPELKANLFMAEGARHMVQSARWSFLSFSGIGFGYPATLRLEKSKVREIELQSQKISNKIENQVSLAYEKLANLELRIQTQAQLLVAANANLVRVKELYDRGLATLAEYVQAQQTVLFEERGLISVSMEKTQQIADTKRLLGLDASMNDFSVDSFEDAEIIVKASRTNLGKTGVSVDILLPEHLKLHVVSVTYAGDIFNRYLLNTNNNLSLYTKVKMQGTKTVKATLLLVTGAKIELITNIDL